MVSDLLLEEGNVVVDDGGVVMMGVDLNSTTDAELELLGCLLLLLADKTEEGELFLLDKNILLDLVEGGIGDEPVVVATAAVAELKMFVKKSELSLTAPTVADAVAVAAACIDEVIEELREERLRREFGNADELPDVHIIFNKSLLKDARKEKKQQRKYTYL